MARNEASGGRRITSLRQLELLVEFMEAHRDLALGRVLSKEDRAMASRLWNECSTLCNAEGTYRTPKEWARYWNDLKGRVKSKLRSMNRSLTGTGGGPATEATLTPIEDRVAAILGRDVVAPLQDVQQDPFQSQNLHTSADIMVCESQQSPVIVETVESDIVDMEIVQQPHIVTLQPHTQFQVEPTISPPHTPTTSAQSQSEHRPRLRTRQRSTVPSQSALDESRAIFARIEESKLKMEEKRAEADLKKTEALMEIARAIFKVADLLSSHLARPTPHEHGNSRQKRARVVDSSDDSSESDN